jgi:hypothetical protein
MPAPMVSPEPTQARILLCQHVFRESLRGLSAALEQAGLPAIQASEKEALWAATERGVWALPDGVFRGADAAPESWTEETAARSDVIQITKDAIKEALAGRRRAKA